jgi:hypothetical protein
LSQEELDLMNAYGRAANHLSVGQIYLYANPLLKEPLKLERIKPRLLGHWGTTPGLNFIYVHLNRVIKTYNLDMIFICGPGHGGPAMVANTYLEGTYSEPYPDVSEDVTGLCKLFKQFSFPYGVPSHATPEVPGSINEGGELGYSLSHAYGAAFDNPDLIVARVGRNGDWSRVLPTRSGLRTRSCAAEVRMSRTSAGRRLWSIIVRHWRGSLRRCAANGRTRRRWTVSGIASYPARPSAATKRLPRAEARRRSNQRTEDGRRR